MKSKEVEIGMAVIPHDKTMGYCNFHEWLFATGLKTPPVLQVKSWEKGEKAWLLDNMSTLGNGGLFSAKDFEPYSTPFTEVRFIKTGILFRQYVLEGIEVYRPMDVIDATGWSWWLGERPNFQVDHAVRYVYMEGSRVQACAINFGNLIEEIK